MSFICEECNKSYTTKHNLIKHNNHSLCLTSILKNKILYLEKKNLELEIENETLRNNPITVNHIDNRQIVNNTQQNNLIHVNTQSSEEYFKSIPGLPKIDMSKGYHRGKMERAALEIPSRNSDKTDFDFFFNQAFNQTQIKNSVIIKNKRDNICDIKYAGTVKPFDEHDDLIIDITEFGKSAISKSIEKHDYKKAHLVQNVGDRSKIEKSKKAICRRLPKRTWRELKKKQVICIESIE